MNLIRGGSSHRQSFSVDSRRHVRQHVDSMVLRMRQVARALFTDDPSCEILSQFPGRVVARSEEQATAGGDVQKVLEVAVNFAKVVDALYGDLGLSVNSGAVGKGADHGEKAQASEAAIQQRNHQYRGKYLDVSGDSTTQNSYGGRELQGRQLNYRTAANLSASNSNRSISGIGQKRAVKRSREAGSAACRVGNAVQIPVEGSKRSKEGNL
ncbi:hypothetical protein COLO4_22743 [Corchorus olitorius]|uniref:Uncharacterized protein n=1 Tax=Corchorus olitorius TaxID=93759 RepID=A0A1R3IKA1_9ROSI|nr:hypothetical protein COLO4_22743 [Corchorus olitorius]